ncbi:MAG: GTPase HflX [Ignavibacteriales bacterium]|nr:GTPase HflX [Ignavibacteriales bacterium]
MIDIISNKIERAILVAVKTRYHVREVVYEHMNELEELARTAGAVTIRKIVQEKTGYDGTYYLGKGKAHEIAEMIEEEEIDLLIFDDDLTPGQARNLEALMKRKILDRSGLILDIFAQHAKTKTSRTQVELAQLQYLLPRLTRAWTHLSKQFGGIGTKGPGETQIETDRRLIRDRISFLKDKLKEIEGDRNTQTKLRKETTKVTLVGYTNAGKSTLFNMLAAADALAEDKLFATLDATPRDFNRQKNTEILLSDTVGFIRKLPHQLIASFKSTLSEVREADILLHVVDISHPFYEDHIAVVEQTLEELGCKDKKLIRVFNKIDLVEEPDRITFLINKYPGAVVTSAAKGMNIGKLKEVILEIIEGDFVEQDYVLPLEKSHLISKVHQFAEVLSTNYEETGVSFRLKYKKENSPKLLFLEK